ncbi:aldehyde dehydrogenase (NADP(+)) [Aquirufa regiilacus]|uniref:Aldehyde dehydrogenase (NADP(+)) n=1 Tax=Aquirufa regiilacus TaxID=3024868 RepID=A0ABU3TPR8_9BACT|nr:aldehyde dehydrogenase (NADP(+)) [Aquirufa sp. LEOWEIH-7C]MDU0807834.1 aldehyde dehydrogenase (NADP(+)) [Aquirufa sp. LEOWEIH-7C]
MNLTGKQIIGFQTKAAGHRNFQGIQATTGEVLPQVFVEATDEEANEALAKASVAFKVYRNLSDAQRANFLNSIAEEILAIGDVLIQTACAESGLPEARITGERGRTIGQIQAFANFISNPSWKREIVDEAMPERQPLPKPRLVQKQIPLGPTVVFGASNFPLAFSVAGGDTLSALAAGCPVVFKAHPAHPNTCDLVGQAIQKAAQKSGMPDGTFSLLHAQGHEIGGYLIKHAITKAVAFTGSYRGGKALFDLAVRREVPIPVYAEMGSINPVYLFSERIATQGEGLADAFSQSICLGVGQFCTNPGLIVLLEKDVAFLTSLASKLDAMPLGTFLTAGIKDAFAHGWNTLNHHPATTRLTASEIPAPSLFSTTVREAIAYPEVLEEVFGPCTVAVVCKDLHEMIAFTEQMPGQLTATIQAEPTDLASLDELIDEVSQKVGRILLNGFPTGVEVSPAMVHGGPFPATSDARSTSVGTEAIYRFTRPVCWQNF